MAVYAGSPAIAAGGGRFGAWRYAGHWCRWRRAGLSGLVSLKGGLGRVVIEQLRALGRMVD